MSYQSQMDREEDHLVEMYNSGQITLKEFNAQMRELQRDHQAMAQEAAERAYDDEMARW